MTPDMEYHRKMHEDTRPVPEPDSIQLTGLELERAVQREVLNNDQSYEIKDLQTLLSVMQERGFTIKLSGYSSGWHCTMKLGDMWPADDRVVREVALHSPAVAVAKAALAAVRYWPA